MRTLLSRCQPAAGGGGGDLVPNYDNPQRGDPDIIIPASGADVGVVAGIGAWGAYAQIVAATPQDLVLTLVNAIKLFAATGKAWIEIATGAAGAEVPLCTVALQALITGAAAPYAQISQRVGPYKVPAGTRLSARAWQTNAGGTTTSCILSFCLPTASWVDPWPNTYIGGGRVTGPHRRDPVVPNWYNPIAISPNWTQIVAAAPNDMLLDMVEWDGANNGGGFGNIMEIGIGAAGAEVVNARAAFSSIRVNSWLFGTVYLGRKLQVLTGERVAARMVKAAGASQDSAFYWIDYV